MKNIISAFEAAVREHGEKPALVFRSLTLSYQELDTLSGRIASKIRDAGAGPGDTVTVCAARGIETAASVLGVLRSGAAVCVIDTQYPEERRIYIEKDAASKVHIDDTWLQDLPEEAALPEIEPGENSPAVIVYTSGSTGAPKGVVNSHHALNMAVHGFTYGRTDSDILLSVASFSFIAGILEILAPLLIGAVLHIADDETRRDGVLLTQYIQENAITSTFLPPQMARFVLPRTEDQLRTLLTGSDRVSGLWSSKVRIFNTYGASETCGPVTRFEIDRPYPGCTPVGKANEGSRVFVLDDDLKELPAGETGEICIGGQIAEGYMNLPQLTEERFVSFDAAPGGRIFRTGDLGYMDADGNLVFVQRKDWMIKIRGYRVEPGEIEASLKERAGASEAVVKAFENAAGETALFAVYTASEHLDPADVKSRLSNFLPEYMVPAFLEQRDSLPVNANGKVDRASISAPDTLRYRAAYESPATPEEERIVAAFEEVLGTANVSALDDFNLLGGDSITAAMLQAKLPDLGFSAADILSVGTPRALAALKDSRMQKAGPRDTWPLTFAERQMAAEQGMHPESVEYNINSQGVRIHGNLDAERLQDAVSRLISRHPILRSSYPQEHGEYVHRVLDSVHVPVEVIPCRPEETEKLARELNQPFSLADPPLFRVHLFAHAPDDHTLHFTFHHIIMDGASWNTFIGELFALYDGRTLQEPSLSYLDHAVWQQDHEELAPGEAFFRNMFSDGLPETEMPTHPIRPDVLPPADQHIEARLDISSLQQAAKRLGVTKYELLLSTLGMTLAKYTGGEDVVVGTAMSGRTKKEQDGMIGMFVNTLPIRLQPKGDDTVREFAAKTARQVRGTKKNQTYPFERLVPVLAPDRNMSRGPVFDVLFNYLQKEKLPRAEGLTFEPAMFPRQELAVDLMIEALVEDDGVRLAASFSDKLYDRRVIENFLEQFMTTLSRIEEGDALQLVEDACELPDRQREQILVDFAGEKTEANAGRTVVDLFREQAKRTPDHEAVFYEGKSLTYKELDDVSDRLASRLSSLGLGRGSTAGIMVGRGLNMPVCALGVLKTGAAYLPLDPEYPAERLEYMLCDAGAALIVADEELAGSVPGYNGAWVYTKDIPSFPPAENLPEGPAPDDLFILLYTSGTTGNPKGVMLLEKNLAAFCDFYSSAYNLGEDDRVAAYASFGFDAAMMDMYPALTSGASVYIIPEKMRLDLPGMRGYFEEHGITVAFMTTQLGRQFAEKDAQPPFRALSTGGETLVPINPPNFHLYNLYGPTECTVFVTRHEVTGLDDRVPIGRPTANTSLYVVDHRGRLAPVGVAGELGIAGRQVSAGYLNRPDLTEEKFIKNPFSDDPSYARMYRSGDVVRFLPDGSVDFVGRKDSQVKIRGFRVELTEIEGRIREFPGIRDAAVTAQDDAGGGKRIAAYIVADKPVDIPALNSFIEETLPPYMVPAATMQIERIPLNQNGKVDRRRLPKIRIQAEEVVPPRTELEKQIHEVLSGILGTDEFGVNQDLMYLGLNSLSSIKAAALVTEKTGRVLSTMDLMRLKTIEKTARLLEEGEAYEEKTFEKLKEYPLTQNQLGLYFAVVKDPGTLVYNIPFVLEFPSSIDADRLEQSFRDVVNAHPYVKTYLRMRDNEPVQVRNDEADVQISRTSGTEDEAKMRRESFVRPFSFFEGPLYHAEIMETPEHVYLFSDFHHMIFDGGSMDIFLRDLEAAYAGEKLTAESFTSFELALEGKTRLENGEAEAAKAFFAKELSDGEGATVIPPDKAGSGGEPKTVRAAVPKTRIQDALKGLGVTPSNLFLAATALVTQRFASCEQVRIATITNGRDGLDVQNSLGMLVETMPAILDPAPGLESRTYLENTQKRMIETLEHKAYPYLYASSDFGYDAQILYAFQGGVITHHELGGEAFSPQVLGIDRAKFPISVNIQEDSSEYVVEAEYDDAIFAEDTIAAFAQCTAYIAEKLVTSQSEKLSSMSIMTPQQAAIVSSFNEKPEPVKGNSLNGYFEEWARKTPEREALVAAGETLTFSELNERANRLAHALLEKGVHRHDRVAFMLPRTSRILTSMLGIVKTGAAYIPVDPEYPEERIAHILEDSGARFILTEDGVSLPGMEEKLLGIDSLLASSENTENPDVPIRQTDLAYMIYTSGSTGKPKGVMIEHRNIMNYVSNVPRNIPDWALTQNDCSMVSVTTVSFDMFLKEAFTTLMNGQRLILADDDESRNPDKLAALFGKTGGNAFNATPSRMLQYMELPEIRKALSKCKVVMAGGEAYPAALYVKLRQATDAELINTYGPTEITVSCNAKVLDSDNISIGRPLYGVVEQVMDVYGNPLPCGVTGELWIGGNGVGRGYWGNEKLTSEQFVEFEGSRWYKSGDLAKWTPDGNIRILGRNDSQIKLRGLRIELGEIEKALSAVPGIRAGAVLVRQLHGQEHLCAYYTADSALRPEDVRDELSKTLTRYMVPTAYLQMENLPMTPNGKLDRKALPDAEMMRREEYSAPTNDKEKAYTEIFEDILKLDRVGIDDSFFDLGGTSLLVTQVTIDAAARGLKISYGDVFANPTPRELAAIGESEKQRAADDMSGYSYDAINALLEENTIDNLVGGELRDTGNIALSGTTGFLGIHVLREYLRTEKGTAYCIVRGKGALSAADRLKSLLVYYFSDSFDDLFGSRIVIVEGDVTDKAVFEKLRSYPIDTFINCAANVKHFSAGTDIEDVNVGGVRNAIQFCLDKKCRFIQISTASTAGMRVDGTPEETITMNEQMLYFGQDLGNKYTNSKFLAERLTLEAAAEKGLDAKIMRVGNLMAREEDGEFQANFRTNNFLSRLRAYSIIGRIPYEALGINTEFAPIDYTARAVLTLAKTPKENRVFHPYNDHSVFFSDIVAALSDMGIEISPSEMCDYEKAYADAMRDKGKARHLNSLIAYEETGRKVEPIATSTRFTQQALLRLGFRWPITTPEYLRSFFRLIRELGFFDQEGETGNV